MQCSSLSTTFSKEKIKELHEKMENQNLLPNYEAIIQQTNHENGSLCSGTLSGKIRLVDYMTRLD